MDRNKELLLTSKYPSLLSDIYGDPRETCLAFGMECGDGWYDLIDNFLWTLQQYLNNRKINDLKITQIKEKYGTLRIYTDYSDDVILYMTELVENISSKICEVCGNKGNIKEDGFISVRCEEHK